MPAIISRIMNLQHPLFVPAASSVLASLLLSLVLVAAYAFPLLSGDHAAFVSHPTQDMEQGIIGLLYFIRSGWNLPLFDVPHLGHGGANIIFTDSIPLAALAAKLVYQTTGVAINYFGAWIFLSLVLQGPAFVLVLLAGGIRDVRVLLLGGVLALFIPALIFRFNHVALCSHFLILLAVAAHLGYRRDAARSFPARALTAVLAAALLVHVYLFAMIGVIFLACWLEALWHERLRLKRALLIAGGVAAVLLIIMSVGGHLASGAPAAGPAGGFGYFSMNLASPVIPQRSGLVPGLRDVVIDATGGQYEGFNYWGAGGLLIVGAAFWERRRDALAAMFRNAALWAVVGGTVLFSVSYAVYALDWLVLGVDYESIASRFGVVRTAQGSLFEELGWLGLVRAFALVLLIVAALVCVLWSAWSLRKTAFLVVIAGIGGALAAGLLFEPHRAVALVSQFRSSGRFFWVVTYVLLSLSVVTLHERWPLRSLVPLLGVAAALQIADTLPLQQSLRKSVQTARRYILPDQQRIAAAFAGSDRVVLVPSYACAQSPGPIAEKLGLSATEMEAAQARLLDLQLVAGWTARPINSVSTARGHTPDCLAEAEEGLHRPGPPKTAYVYLEPFLELLGGLPPTGRARCSTISVGVMCLD